MLHLTVVTLLRDFTSFLFNSIDLTWFREKKKKNSMTSNPMACLERVVTFFLNPRGRESKERERYSPFLACRSVSSNLSPSYIHIQRRTVVNQGHSCSSSRALRLRLIEMVVVVMVLVMMVVFVSLHHLRQAAFVQHDARELPHLLLLHHRPWTHDWPCPTSRWPGSSCRRPFPGPLLVSPVRCRALMGCGAGR